MTKLSEHFHDYEFVCPCCNGGIVSEILVSKLQQLRDIVNKPIRITSGYRCYNYNDRIGGAVNSAHLLGEGVDIQTELSTVTLAMITSKIKGIRIGIYERHLHIDVRPANPSKYWLVKKYGKKPIYSKNEHNFAKFLKNNL